MKTPNLEFESSYHNEDDSLLGNDLGNSSGFTGRLIVTLQEDKKDNKELVRKMNSKATFRVANMNDFDLETFTEDQLDDADVLVFDDLGIALVGSEDDQMNLLSSDAKGMIIEPEQVHFVPSPEVMPMAQTTYGLRLTNVNGHFTGKGVKVAVLDTGMDLKHPDFKGRTIKTSSFVPNERVQDGNGHGTHCIGTSCGDTDMNGLRYGVAKQANIFAGKVLSNAGRGAQSWVLAGMNWAIKSKCDIISMSLGSPVVAGQSFSPAYERVAKNALRNNTLVIAASGNESDRRRGVINPVGSPANCPSILAVAAVDSQLNVANFSTRSINPDGQIDIAAPGVNIYSSWPLPRKYRTISGTSMATPHVAGIAALYKEADPSVNARELWWKLYLDARRLISATTDVGVGLVQAP